MRKICSFMIENASEGDFSKGRFITVEMLRDEQVDKYVNVSKSRYSAPEPRKSVTYGM